MNHIKLIKRQMVGHVSPQARHQASSLASFLAEFPRTGWKWDEPEP
ncbi:hypothetical protein P8605_07380 [Streptomyces sp. T-3]|nr:hypothetical protein [Streptomyces sp. T-3]